MVLDRRIGWWVGAAFLASMMLPFVIVLTLTGVTIGGSTPSATALADIPANYLTLFQDAGAKYGIDWAILAGIGKVECDFGRDPSPACTVPGATNSAGAGGPMQFLASTWATYGVDPNGHAVPYDPNAWNPADAIYTAASYLKASGAPGDYYNAIFAYNHASWYVAEVQRYAASYRAAAARAVPAQTVPGNTATINGQGDALAPANAPAAVQAIIQAGDLIDNKPYPNPDVHYGSLSTPWPAYDCSGTTSFVLYSAGLMPSAEQASAQAEVSGDFESYGDPGPGQWVTIYANSDHVFLQVAGIALNTAWYAPVQPSIPTSGPRWQPASTVAAQLAGDTHGGFVVRHPPGL